jgi:chromate transport protein ChrA
MRAVTVRGSAGEVFTAFLKLGPTSFGGPVAHLGYFRSEFVERRRWLDEAACADLVALCQFLPGPASSKVGMAIGFLRAGYLGTLAAWVAFTLPSALVLVLFAYGATTFGSALGSGWLHGLKVAAVAVLALAVLGMAGSLAPDRARGTLAGTADVVVVAVPSILLAALYQPVWTAGILSARDFALAVAAFVLLFMASASMACGGALLNCGCCVVMNLPETRKPQNVQMVCSDRVTRRAGSR